MTDDRIVVLELSHAEIAQLAALVTQFQGLVQDAAHVGASDSRDPALQRLMPDAYPDDPEASREYRRLTESDLIGRRVDDAGVVLASLAADGETPDPAAMDDASAELLAVVTLDGPESGAWMRTLTALRLVLASRLGITTEDNGDVDDPRYFLYEWLGVRLDGIVRAVAE